MSDKTHVEKLTRSKAPPKREQGRPMTPTILNDLADRVEAAEAASRDLDRAIELALDPTLVNPPVWVTLPMFTASLDAAMSLVPEGWDWLIRNDADEKFAHVTKDFQSVCEVSGGKWVDRSTGLSSYAYAKTTALALTAASLRAIAKEEG